MKLRATGHGGEGGGVVKYTVYLPNFRKGHFQNATSLTFVGLFQRNVSCRFEVRVHTNLGLGFLKVLVLSIFVVKKFGFHRLCTLTLVHRIQIIGDRYIAQME